MLSPIWQKPNIHKAMQGYVALLFLTVCTYTLMYAPQPMFNTISRAFGVDRAAIGMSVGVFMFSLALSPLCVGLLLGKLGVRLAIASAALILAASGPFFMIVDDFSQFLALRMVQGLLTPIMLTSAMAGIVHLFRHLNLARAMAGFIAFSAIGALIGRTLGGVCAEHFGWRLTLMGICLFFPLALLVLGAIPGSTRQRQRVHRPAEYLTVLRQKGVAPLIFVESCGIFVFAALGNLIPFRMAELGQGQSESMAGLMYLGYLGGLVIPLFIDRIRGFFPSTRRYLLFSACFTIMALSTLAIPSLWLLFGAIWLISTGQYLTHSLCPGMINLRATRAGHCDSGMVNGLFLSCYYMGGVLGSFIPALFYGWWGWTACHASILLAGVLAFAVLYRQKDI